MQPDNKPAEVKFEAENGRIRPWLIVQKISSAKSYYFHGQKMPNVLIKLKKNKENSKFL